MLIEEHPVTDLSPLVGNPRVVTDAARDRLERSIRKFGLFKPLLIWKGEDGPMVIGGNQRHAVLSALYEDGKLPLTVTLQSGSVVEIDGSKIPCVVFPGTWAEARAVAARDNTQDGEWDWDMLPDYLEDLRSDLAEEVGDLQEMDLAGMTGFDDQMLEDLATLATATDVDLDRFTGHPDEEPDGEEGPKDDEGRTDSEYLTRQQARFVCGNIRGNIPVDLYNYFVEVFHNYSKEMDTTEIPEILGSMLDDLENR